VITPGRFEIYFDNETDAVSGGVLDHDEQPDIFLLVGRWTENIFFPMDDSAPPGRYTFFVRNFHQVDDELDS
jgi:hypothetical protein